MVRYPIGSLPCTLAEEVQLFPGLGIYSGILAIYFQYQLNKSTGRKTTMVFYAICLLYLLSTVSFISDLAAAKDVVLEPEVSNNSICIKNIIFYQLCSQVSIHRFPLQLSKAYQPVVVIFSPNVS